MIYGIVNNTPEPVFRLRVRGPSGAEMVLDLVMDTGYSGALALPTTTIIALGLLWHSIAWAALADGTLFETDYFEAELEWGSGWRSVLVLAVGSESLLGMRCLSGHRLSVVGDPGGLAEITPWP